MGILKNYIEGKTDLNRLSYSEMSVNEAKPIITKSIPTSVSQAGPRSNQLSTRVDDLKRIASLVGKKEGQKFLTNTAALEASKFINKGDKSSILKKGLQTLKATAQTVASTLAQVPVNGTGTHFVYQFKTDTYLQPPGGNTRSAFAQFFGAGGIEGAPMALRGESIIQIGNNDSYKPPIAESNFVTNIPSSKQTPTGRIKDFKSVSAAPGVGAQLPPISRKLPEALEIRKELRVNLGDPTGNAKSPIKTISTPYDKLEDDAVDKINALAPYTFATEDNTASTAGLKTGGATNDLAKFRFKLITPETSTYLHFRAYLENLSDSYNANWNGYKYVGRGEEMYTYDSFRRVMNIQFKIAAQTRAEMRPLYQKIVALASATAPTYSRQGFMRGTFAQMTVGSYVYEMPGFIESVAYTWNTDYSWEIALNGDDEQHGDSGQQELPMVLDCNVSFTPIHRFTPQTGLHHYITNPYKNKFFDPPTSPNQFGNKLEDKTILPNFQNNVIPARERQAATAEERQNQTQRDMFDQGVLNGGGIDKPFGG